MKIKRMLIITLIVAFVMNVFLATSLSEATASLTIDFDNGTAIQPGEEFSVSVNLRDLPEEVYMFQFAVTYDSSKLTLESTSAGAFFATAGNPTINSAEAGIVYINWDSINKAITEDCTLILLTFLTLGDEPYETSIGFSESEEVVFANWNNAIDVSLIPLTVKIGIDAIPAFKTQSLVLDGQIGVHFFVFLPANSGYEYQGVNFTIDNVDSAETFVPYGADTPQNAKGYYRFTYYVRSIEMADTITATLQYTVNGEARTLEKTYSVKQYFETFDNYMSLFMEKEQVMTKATADYGHYVQACLETQHTWTIGTDYAEMDKFYTVYTADDISAAQSALQAYAAEKSLGSNMQKITCTLVLDSDTELRIYFKPSADYTGTYTFTMDGEAIAEDGEKVSVKLKPDGWYLVSIRSIAAHDLSMSHRIAAVGDGVESYIELSALSYVNAMITAYASNATAVNAAVAILRYAEAAHSLKYGD